MSIQEGRLRMWSSLDRTTGEHNATIGLARGRVKSAAVSFRFVSSIRFVSSHLVSFRLISFRLVSCSRGQTPIDETKRNETVAQAVPDEKTVRHSLTYCPPTAGRSTSRIRPGRSGGSEPGPRFGAESTRQRG